MTLSSTVLLDAVFAAPDYHRVVLENERVRVLDTRIAPVDCIRTVGQPCCTYLAGVSLFATMTKARWSYIPALKQPFGVQWSEPLGPHSPENVALAELHILCIELKL